MLIEITRLDGKKCSKITTQMVLDRNYVLP